MKKHIVFKTKLWLWPGESANWHFVSLPKDVSRGLREVYKGMHRGWNSLPVEVRVGKIVWSTSMFFDSKSQQYILPIKAKVRQQECIYVGDDVKITLKIKS